MRPAVLALFAAFAAAPVSAETVRVTVTEADCANFVAHVPDASVAYKPGVTADGRQVAPADLAGSSFTVTPPEKIVIDIQIDLQKRLGIPSNAGQYSTEGSLGKVTIENGKATYNGQELATGAQNAIAEACRELRRKR
jgi:hypothetical protein